VFSATGTQLAIVHMDKRDLSFQVRIWDVSNSKGADSAEPENESFRSKWNYGSDPNFIRFSSNEPLVPVQHSNSYYDNKVIVWNRMTDAVEEHDYDQDSHSSLKPTFGEDRGWIVSIRTGRRLIWLPESRRSLPYRTCFAIHGNLIATGSSSGVLSLLDLSPFEGI
jgi:hypothetical protein